MGKETKRKNPIHSKYKIIKTISKVLNHFIDNKEYIDGVISRKKQVAPKVEEKF